MIDSRQIGLKHSLICSFILLFATPVHGQIIPDNTLGAENSRLTPNVQIQGAAADRIEGGAQRGGNLFHSFSQFSVNEGQRAYFVNPIGVENIFTRVTGGQVSNILGTLGVEGGANLFLLNPNGILFGPNARLDVSGSFVGTTANAFRFGEQGIFSATNPSAPPLLTVNPSAFLFNQLNPQAITNQSQASAGVNPAGTNVTGLRVEDGQSILLVGGNINFDGGALRAYGGNIELAALAAPGDVGLNVAGNNLSLTLPNGVELADISLTNGAEVNVRGADAGSIRIHARNLNLAGESKIRAGIDTGLGTPNSKALDIDINATGTITLTNASFIANVPQATSLGNGGNINITAGSLTLLDGSYLNTNNFGQGDGGNVNLNIRDRLTIAGVDRDGLGSAILSDVQSQADGKGGSINITAGSFSLSDGAFLSASTSGKGDAGSISIQARDAVSLSYSNIFSNVEAGGVGNGGNINIGAGVLTLKDGSQLQTLLRDADSENKLPGGRGNAGNVNVDVLGEVNISGQKNDLNSSIRSVVGTGAEGNGGNINIKSGSLSLTDDALLTASTFGKGDAGSISIQARDAVSLSYSNIYSNVEAGGIGNGGSINILASSLSVKDGSQLQTLLRGADSKNNLPGGRGNAGNVNVDVLGEVNISGEKNGFNSSIRSVVGTGAEGNGGNINLKSGSLSLTDGALLTASTFGKGDAGNIFINTRDRVSFDGRGSSQNPTGAYTTFESFEVGKAGNIELRTGSLFLSNGAQLGASTFGKGDGGNITVDALETVKIEGTGNNGRSSGVFSTVELNSVGDAGNIELRTGSLFLGNRGFINGSTFGQGNAGNIFVNVNGELKLNEGYIVTSVGPGGTGNAGNIDIQAFALSLVNGSEIDSALLRSIQNQPAARGRSGNIRINTTDSVTISGISSRGFSSAIFTASDKGTSGAAGDITINTGTFRVSDGAIVSAATSNSDNGGDIIINAKTFEALSGGQVATNSRGSGTAGTITLNVQDSLLLSGSDPNFSSRVTSVQQRLQQPGESDQLDDVIFNQGAASGLFANTAIGATGNGGSIFVDPPVVTIRDGAKISVNSDGTGNAGNITLLAGTLSLDNGASISAQTASSQGGNINLQLGRLLLLRRNSQISTSAGTASAGGDGGNLTINSPFIVSVPGENNDISANAYSGKGGSIRINTQGIFGITTSRQSTSNSDITASSQLGVQGQIAIDQPEVQRNQEAIELPEQVLDASNQIDQTCAKGNVARSIGEFYVTGRGSLPPNPLEPLAGTVDLTALATLDGEVSAEVGTGETGGTRETRETRDTGSDEIVEAQGWVKTADGQIALVAVAPEVTPSAVTTSAMCSISQSKQLGTSR
ncbi:hypothetical protein NUACC21_30360 [Scytonema sp. NUACC21]